MTDKTLNPPKHLRVATKQWWRTIVENFVLENHHVLILTKAAEAFDRAEQAREVLAKEGLTYVDRFGQPRARPETTIERDSRSSFAKLLRELGLDVEPADPNRMPDIRGKRGR